MKKIKEEKRSEGVYIAVFNAWNEDVKKAKQIYKIRYGIRSYNAQIHNCVTRGIMSLFQEKCTKQRVYFAIILAELSCARHGWTLKTNPEPFRGEE